LEYVNSMAALGSDCSQDFFDEAGWPFLRLMTACSKLDDLEKNSTLRGAAAWAWATRQHGSVNPSATAAEPRINSRRFIAVGCVDGRVVGGGALEDGVGMPSIVCGSISSTRVPSGS